MSKDLKDKSFPDCYEGCGAASLLGVSECESVCPEKFQKYKIFWLVCEVDRLNEILNLKNK